MVYGKRTIWRSSFSSEEKCCDNGKKYPMKPEYKQKPVLTEKYKIFVGEAYQSMDGEQLIDSDEYRDYALIFHQTKMTL